MISVIDFFIFAVVVLGMAVLSVKLRHILYAVLCQIQAVVALSGMLVALNARFISFALLSMSASAFIIFLLFALFIFEPQQDVQEKPVGISKILGLFFVLTGLEMVWLFFKTAWHPETQAMQMNDFSLSVLGGILYSHYALCVLTFGVLLLSAMVGITTLLTDARQDDTQPSVPAEQKETAVETVNIPIGKGIS